MAVIPSHVHERIALSAVGLVTAVLATAVTVI